MLPKSVLVTGANRGIGLEIVRQLVASGDGFRHVIACCRDPSRATDLAKIADEAKVLNVQVHLVKLEVTDDDQIANVVKQVESIVGDKGLNLLINNAGILQSANSKLPTVERVDVLRHLNVNAASPLIVTQALLPLLRKASQLHASAQPSVFRAGVLNITSGLGSISENTSGGERGGYGYRMSKAALNMVTKCLAIDLKNDGIIFASICPGWVKTDMGGSNAMVNAQDSVSSILQTLRQLKEEHSGGYFKRDGQPYLF